MRQDKDLLELLNYIPSNGYVTSGDLSKYMQISIRTIRKRVKDLNEVLSEHGAFIESKARYGYRIVIENQKKYEQLCNTSKEISIDIPVSREERIQYLLYYFLNKDQYTKADDLIDQLYISRGTLSGDLKQVEQVFDLYGIKMERRPNYGMKLDGSEFDKRRCMVKYLDIKEKSRLNNKKCKCDELIDISKIIVSNANKYTVSFSETALEQFVKVLYVQIFRIREGKLINSLLYELSYLNKEENKFINELETNIQKDYGITLSEEERKYLSLHFEGKRTINGKVVFDNQENFIIYSFIEELVNNMLEQVYINTGIDMRNNLQLIITLSQHMVPLDIRIRYSIFLENPMLDFIKEKYILSYNIAIQAVSVLNQYYGIVITENEIGLIALIFALSFEQAERKEVYKKLNILIVCNSGKALSQLLMIQFQREFNEYINKIYISDVFSIDSYDFSKINYVFTTVPIKQHIPVPIQEIGLFMEPRERESIRRFLDSRNADKILSVYCKNHFFTHINGETREECLQNICKEVYRVTNFKPGLYDSVLRRELLSSTDYGNMVAIPHPDKTWSDKTYVFVSVLDNEILWNNHKVKIVFLILMGGIESEQHKEFYEITTRLVTNKLAIQKLIEAPSYDTLVRGLIGE